MLKTIKEFPDYSIEDTVSKLGWTKAAKMFGVTDNGLRNKYKRFGKDPKNLKRVRSLNG